MNNTLEIVENHLRNIGALDKKIPDFFKTLISIITGNVPDKLKLSIALSEFITLTSQSRKPIMLYDGTLVPCNAISFLLASSGFSKDRTKSMVRDTFSDIYIELEENRMLEAKKQAQEIATAKGEDPDKWRRYYKEPVEIFSGLGTPEGVLKHFYLLEKEGLASAFVSSSEVGTDLENESNFKDLIKFLAIGYDLGNIPPKIIKDDKNKTPKITGLPINALLFGSQEAILNDRNIKQKFKTMFNSQLARRTIFSFISEEPTLSDFHSIKEIIKFKDEEARGTTTAKAVIKAKLRNILNTTNKGMALSLSKPAKDLFGIYEEYSSHIAEKVPSKFNMYKTARKHRQWLALKLAGNIAIGQCASSITEQHYIESINLIEYFDEDLKEFEIELFKEPYELFVSYCRKMSLDGELLVNIHELKKSNFVQTGNIKTVLQNFTDILNSYDNEAIYTVEKENSIFYKVLEKPNKCGISTIPISTRAITEAIEKGEDKKVICNLKSVVAEKIAKGYEHNQVPFRRLENMLKQDFAYSPFKFKDGVRGNKNIIGGTKWIVLDVDVSDVNIDECHMLLEGINHFLSTTSDKNNRFKFRALLELDIKVKIEPELWSIFIQAIGKDLGLNVDKLGQSQIYYSYKSKEILSELDGKPYRVKKILNGLRSKTLLDKTKVTPMVSESKLKNKLATFIYAFDAEEGTRCRNMIKACMYARDLNAPLDYILDLIASIKEYWQDPIPLEQDEPLQKIIKQVERWNYE